MALPSASPTPKDELFDFAWIPAKGAEVPPNKAYESRLKELAERAQREDWSFDEDQQYGVLGNYLRYTFKRLCQERKIELGVDSAGAKVAAFNTGLFTPNYEPIYAFFEANRDPSRQPWVLKEFVADSDRRLMFFAGKPKAARYFVEPADLIYDPERELIPNLDHILDENVDRYPADLRENPHRRRMMLQGAVAEAGKRAQMNYKTAVPQFYFGYEGSEVGRIQLLLPLCFDNPARADLALVVERERNVLAYRAFTVLALQHAYSNARLIAKPDADWLPRRPRNQTILRPRLTKRAVGHLHGQEMTDSDPVNRWRVEPLEKEVFIVGFNVGRQNQKEYWQITGRKGNYSSPDEALAVLQCEIDEG